jgi:cytochrome c oxidase subunit II
MLGLAAIIYALVVALLLVALYRRRAPEPEDSWADRLTAWAREPASRFAGTTFVVAGGIALPVLVLIPLSVFTIRTLASTTVPGSEPGLTVEVVGYQFWWEVRYPEHGIVGANEVHIPVGQPVRLTLRSADVIHSFWVPQLMGKMDLVPGQTNATWVQADQPGAYWGECAEFCGIQHAKMAFLLVAEPPDQFAAWLEQQRRPAVEPTDPVARQGAQVFARDGCITCHAIQYGTGTVGGQAGPNLTHVGSRRTIGAGILPNTRGNLGGWIANPQAIKPGNKMPIQYLDSESLLAVVAYLESLK